MKEASGEANLTVVAIILIGVIAAVATPLINNMMNNAKARSECTENGQCWCGGSCVDCSNSSCNATE
ncbi:MAG: hypothetical protein PHD02_01635 [Bacilli bacterium]|nr:hypothetical protein [Bacilli bacterium]